MRVVAGTARGRRLVAPPGRSVRPTGDRVREALFNALGSMDALDGARVLDLFCGSGALGIEALSRGAAHVTFVDSSGGSLAAVRTNLEATGLADRAVVVRAEVLSWLDQVHADVDLVLADPPYAFDRWEELLAKVAAPVVVAESDREVPPPVGGTVLRCRRYGGTVVSILGLVDRDEHGRPTPEDRS